MKSKSKCDWDCFNCKYSDCIKGGYIKHVPIPDLRGRFTRTQLERIKKENNRPSRQAIEVIV